ncbi:winged helix DNA-binding domain-containing protein [Suillus ampliporus]|nr:winged helix DNA-binding domain-containing protein [Suillus ampliporus]
MHRGVEQVSQRRFAELSSELSKTQVDYPQSQLNQFRTALSRFATMHRYSIRSDPAFRHASQQMCSSIGMDPLAGPRKSDWRAEILGMGDWQYELGVQIVDVCVSTRERNGGTHVIRSIKTLQPLGAGSKCLTSMVRELDADQAVVLAEAQVEGEWIVEAILENRRGWTRDRARAALDNILLRDGLC